MLLGRFGQGGSCNSSVVMVNQMGTFYRNIYCLPEQQPGPVSYEDGKAAVLGRRNPTAKCAGCSVQNPDAAHVVPFRPLRRPAPLGVVRATRPLTTCRPHLLKDLAYLGQGSHKSCTGCSHHFNHNPSLTEFLFTHLPGVQNRTQVEQLRCQGKAPTLLTSRRGVISWRHSKL